VRTGNPVSIPNPDVYWDTLGPQRRLAVLATQFYMSNARIIVKYLEEQGYLNNHY